VLLWKHI